MKPYFFFFCLTLINAIIAIIAKTIAIIIPIFTKIGILNNILSSGDTAKSAFTI